MPASSSTWRRSTREPTGSTSATASSLHAFAASRLARRWSDSPTPGCALTPATSDTTSPPAARHPRRRMTSGGVLYFCCFPRWTNLPRWPLLPHRQQQPPREDVGAGLTMRPWSSNVRAATRARCALPRRPGSRDAGLAHQRLAAPEAGNLGHHLTAGRPSSPAPHDEWRHPILLLLPPLDKSTTSAPPPALTAAAPSRPREDVVAGPTTRPWSSSVRAGAFHSVHDVTRRLASGNGTTPLPDLGTRGRREEHGGHFFFSKSPLHRRAQHHAVHGVPGLSV
jgi:hypothetical protein